MQGEEYVIALIKQELPDVYLVRLTPKKTNITDLLHTCGIGFSQIKRGFFKI